MFNYESKNCETYKKWVFLLFRVGFGAFFLLSGLPKFQALIAGNNPLAGFGIAVWLVWIVAIVELVGGGLLILGLLIMPSAILIGITMIVAMLMATLSPFNAKNFFLHWIYIWGAFYIAMMKNHFLAIDSSICKPKPAKKKK